MSSTTIPNLPQVIALNGTELLECVQNGTSSRVPASMLTGGISNPAIVVGFTAITGGISGRLLYDNGGLVGELATTGTGNVVLANGPALVAPVLGTPASGIATNLTGLPLTTGVTGTLGPTNGGTGQATYTTGDILYASATNTLSRLAIGSSGNILSVSGGLPIWTAAGTSVTSFSAGTTGLTPNSATSGAVVLGGTLAVLNGGTGVTTSTGTGANVLSTNASLVTPALGTPSAIVLTSGTGLPISTGVSGLATGIATFLGTPTSANLAAAVTNETGTGALVFATSPVLVTPNLGTPTTLVLTSATGLTSSQVTTALAYTPLNPANNLSDISNVTTARTNLGVGEALLSNGTFSVSTAPVFALSGYNSYRIQIIGLIPSGNPTFTIQFSFDGGATYKSGASDYAYAIQRWNTTAGFTTSSAATSIAVTSVAADSTASKANEIEFTITGPKAAGFGLMVKSATGYFSSGSYLSEMGTGQIIPGYGTPTNIRLVPSTGTVTGAYAVYGRIGF